MPQVGIIVAGEALTWEEAISRAMAGPSQYPASLLRALKASNRQDSVPSASSIFGCLRRFELEKRIDYYKTVESMLPAFFGTAVHKLINESNLGEPGRDGEVTRTLVFYFSDLPEPYQMVEFSGTRDEADYGQGLIRDWKTKWFLALDQEITPEHARQANVYAMLEAFAVECLAGDTFSELEICYLSQGCVVTRRIATPDLGEVYQAVKKRLYDWAICCAAGELPPPLEGHNLITPEVKGKKGSTRPGPAECYYCVMRTACWEEQASSLEDDID